MGDLDKLFLSQEVAVADETITIVPFRFGQLTKVTAKLQAMASAVQKSGLLARVGGVSGMSPDWQLRLPQVMAESSEAVTDLIVLATGKQREWVDALAMDEGLILAKAIIEVNGDFFVKRIAPLMKGAFDLTQATGG